MDSPIVSYCVEVICVWLPIHTSMTTRAFTIIMKYLTVRYHKNSYKVIYVSIYLILHYIL